MALFNTTYYGSYFLFFAAFGWLAAIALFFPFATAMTVLLKHRRVFYAVIGGYLLTTIVVAVLEFSGSPWATFEVAPRILEADPTGMQFLEKLRKICDPATAKYPERFVNFQTTLGMLIQAGRSYSGVLYYFALVAQALFLLAIFFVFLVSIRYRAEMTEFAPKFFRDSIFFLLGYAIFAVFMWCLLRISYRVDGAAIFFEENKGIIYWINNPLLADYLVIFLYAVVLAVYVLYFEFSFEKPAKLLTSFSGFLTFVFGVSLAQEGMASRIIGVRASVFNLVAVILLFLLISLILLAFMLRRPPDPPDS